MHARLHNTDYQGDSSIRTSHKYKCFIGWNVLMFCSCHVKNFQTFCKAEDLSEFFKAILWKIILKMSILNICI